MTVESILVEPLNAAGVEGGRTRVRELLDAVGLPDGRRQPLPAGVLRRAAPAGGDRAGAGPEPRRHRLRRAHERAGRHHPGPRADLVQGAPEERPAWPTCSSATTSASSTRSATASRCSTAGRSSRSARRSRSPWLRGTNTPAACRWPRPSPTRRSSAHAASCDWNCSPRVRTTAGARSPSFQL